MHGALALELEARAVTGKRCPGGVVVHVVGVGALEVVRAELLHSLDGLRRPGYVAAGGESAQLVGASVDPYVPVHLPGVGLAVHLEQQCVPGSEVPAHSRSGKPDRGAFHAKFLLQAGRGPVSGRLDARVAELSGGAVVRPGALLGGDRDQGADGEAARRATGEFAGRQDRCVPGIVGVFSVHAAAWSSPDASRIEQAFRLQQLLALHEEGTPLREKRGKRGQVHLRRIRLDLAEVRVERRVQCQARPDAHLEIGAGPAVELASTRKRIVGVDQATARDLGAAGHIGHQLDRPPRLDTLQSFQIAKPGGPPGFVPRHRYPVNVLALARNVPVDVDSERVGFVPVEAKLRERDPHLRRPADGIDHGVRVPYGVPAVVAVAEVVCVLARVPIQASSGGRDRDGEVRSTVLITVDVDDEPLGIARFVPAGHDRPNLGRILRVHPRAHVQGGFRIHEGKLGALGRRKSRVRAALREVRGERGPAPDLLFQAAVHVDALRRLQFRGHEGLAHA